MVPPLVRFTAASSTLATRVRPREVHRTHTCGRRRLPDHPRKGSLHGSCDAAAAPMCGATTSSRLERHPLGHRARRRDCAGRRRCATRAAWPPTMVSSLGGTRGEACRRREARGDGSRSSNSAKLTPGSAAPGPPAPGPPGNRRLIGPPTLEPSRGIILGPPPSPDPLTCQGTPSAAVPPLPQCG